VISEPLIIVLASPDHPTKQEVTKNKATTTAGGRDRGGEEGGGRREEGGREDERGKGGMRRSTWATNVICPHSAPARAHDNQPTMDGGFTHEGRSMMGGRGGKIYFCDVLRCIKYIFRAANDSIKIFFCAANK